MKELFLILEKLYKLKPWKHMAGEDFIQMVLPEFPTPVLVSVIGNEGIRHGFLVCHRPQDTTLFVEQLFISDEPNISFRRYQNYFSISYETTNQLKPIEKEVLRKHYGTLNQVKVYPSLERYDWGKIPRMITLEESTFLKSVFEHVFLSLEESINKKMFGDFTKGKHLTRYYDALTKSYHTAINPLLSVIASIEFNIQLRHEFPKNHKESQLEVEIDAVYLPFVDPKDGYFPLMCLLADHRTGAILKHKLLSNAGNRDKELMEFYLDCLHALGHFKIVRCRNHFDYQMIIGLLKQDGTTFVYRKPMRYIDEFINQILKDKLE